MLVIKAGYSAWRGIATELKDVSEKMAKLWQNGWSLFIYIIRIRITGKKKFAKTFELNWQLRVIIGAL